MSKSLTKMGALVVDRSLENIGDDSRVSVKLTCGFTCNFWLTGLSDAEYVDRAKQIKAIEEGDRK